MSTGGRIAVVGAGWAGLACAAELAAAGRPVTVFEASRRPGGRARSIELDGHLLDNGQHLLVGAYSETLRLMRRIGLDPDSVLQRLPLQLDTPGRFRLRLPRLPAPWHLACGLLAAKGVPLRDKLSAAAFMHRLKARRYRLERDGSVADWLDREGQTGPLRHFLWEPLCLAALNTPLTDASAQIFANVLRDSLGGRREATDLLLQRTDLGQVFAEPAARFIAAHGGEIRHSTRIGAGDIEGGGEHGKGWRWQIAGLPCEHLVLAVAPQHLASLLRERPAHAPLLQRIAGYAYEPIGTLYLAYPETVRLPFPMLGLSGPLGHWVFDRRTQGGPAGLLACVFSAHGEWEGCDDETLAAHLHQEITAAIAASTTIATFSGPLPAPRWHRVIRERRATFACRPNLERPGTATAEPGLWLAGDHVCMDYPATLEGAIRSGVAAAQAILGRPPGTP